MPSKRSNSRTPRKQVEKTPSSRIAKRFDHLFSPGIGKVTVDPKCRKKLNLSQTLITDKFNGGSNSSTVKTQASDCGDTSANDSQVLKKLNSKQLKSNNMSSSSLTPKEQFQEVSSSQVSNHSCIIVEAEIHPPPRNLKVNNQHQENEVHELSEVSHGKENQDPKTCVNVEVEKDSAKTDGIPKTTPAIVSTPKYAEDLHKLGRYRVLECDLSEDRQQMRLVLQPEFGNYPYVKRICMLRDLWLTTAIEVGDVVHIHSNWYELWDDDDDKSVELAIIDRLSGFIVVRPDLLLSGSTVASSLICRRKAVLSERFKRTEPNNRVMIAGTLIHRLVQKALMGNAPDMDSLRRMMEELLQDPSTVHDLYGASLTATDIKGDVEGYLPAIRSFFEQYIKGDRPTGQCHSAYGDETWNGHIESILDIEDNWWSPKLGLKGKVDATVQVKGRRVPLELKTGRSTFSSEHKGQVTLYSMIMKKEVDYKPKRSEDDALLLYLSDGTLKNVPHGIEEQQGLVQLRNDLVSYLTAPSIPSIQTGGPKEGRLPPVTDRPSICGSCPIRTECSIYQMAEMTAPNEADHLFASHLTPADRQYFMDWSLMLRLEWETSKALDRPLSDIWCLPPADRQAQGHCLARLQVEECRSSEQNVSGLSKFTITLIPAKKKDEGKIADDVPSQSQLLPKTDLQLGDNVALSTDDRIALVTGSVLKVGPTSITIGTDRDVSHSVTQQEVHLDKLDYQGDQSLLYTNLSRLVANNPQAARLRRIVVDRKKPTLRNGLKNSLTEIVLSESGKAILERLNKLQQRAVLSALICRNYCLIDGLPGTGKTVLIVALIRLAALCGLSVLLTSYTHSAVDNVLTKLLQAGFKDFIRIGRTHRIHADILPFSAELKSLECRTVDEVNSLYSVPVFASTCLHVGHPAISNREKPFDLCIVDEAAQALQLAVVGPLTAANRFVLVGDPRQLPPVVQSKAAKRMGMAESLFQRLSNAWPDKVIRLRQQYRMCGPLNALANKLTYSGDLICANGVVESATLPVRNNQQDAQDPSCAPWLSRVVQGGLDRALIFLDTSLLPVQGQQTIKSNGCLINPTEAKLAILIASTLNRFGVEYCDMGLIAPYQSQVRHLRSLTEERMPELEVNSVDQYQGRDKSVIIYSCTKVDAFRNLDEDTELQDSNAPSTILHDLRRLTVAVTRAKHKLIIIGHGSSLHQYAPFARLMDNLERNQRYILRPGNDGFDLSFTSA